MLWYVVYYIEVINFSKRKEHKELSRCKKTQRSRLKAQKGSVQAGRSRNCRTLNADSNSLELLNFKLESLTGLGEGVTKIPFFSSTGHSTDDQRCAGFEQQVA